MKKLERELSRAMTAPTLDQCLQSTVPLIPGDIPDQRPYRPKQVGEEEEEPSVERWELRSVVAVFRHGDRTPKQKMKMRTKDQCFLKFFEGKPNLKKEVKLKTPRELQVSLFLSHIS